MLEVGSVRVEAGPQALGEISAILHQIRRPSDWGQRGARGPKRCHSTSRAIIEWLTDNGSGYIAHDTEHFARDITFEPCATPVDFRLAPDSATVYSLLYPAPPNPLARFAG
jgi:hypothetical protein